MFTVIKIGGCNGSGKSSVARAIIEAHDLAPKRRHERVEAYVGAEDGVNISVLGRYETACGGMDTISDKDHRMDLVKRYAKKGGGIVVFEGLITGKTYGAFGELSEMPAHKGRWLYAFMDTPYETCVERVLQRRAEKGNDAPFDPERTMSPTFKAVASVARRASSAGHHVHHMNHKHTPTQIANKLLERAWSIHHG